MPYGIRIELSGIDITSKVSRFEITAAMDSYVRELSLDIADPDYYDTFDFSILPEAPTLEVFTRIAADWVSQGTFFIEKPTYRVGIHQTDTGLWGRSTTALLGSPFAPKLNRVWDTDAMFFSVCEEMCALSGLTWDAAYSDIPDFMIYAYSYQAEGLYPIEVLSELLALAYGEDAKITTDRAGHLCIRLVDRAPAAYDHDVTDLVIAEISEEPEWPDFGNRVKISATGFVGGFGVQVSVVSECLAPTYRTKLLARVTDQDGNAVNNISVDWSVANGLVTLDRATSNTQTVIITDEEVRAENFYEITLEYPPETIIGVWAAKDTAKTVNLAEGGYQINGNTITLTGKLRYCDQLVRVNYTSAGVAVNWATAGSEAGTETVTADVMGNSESAEIYVDNPCACPPSITFQANTTSIKIGESARLLTYVEIAGAPVTDGRSIYNTIDSVPAHGVIDWTKNRLGTVTVTSEKTSAVNEISGISQCDLSMFPASVSGVWTFTDDDGNVTKTGSNLYSSHSGKTVNLNTQLTAGTELIADYTAQGATVNTFFGKALGTEQIRAFITTTREEPTEATVSISVTDETDTDTPDLNDGTDYYDDEFDSDTDYDTGSGGSDGYGSGDDDTWNPTPTPNCTKADGTTVKCGSGETCCEKGGVRGCWPWTECDKQPDLCKSKDCTKDMSPECLQTRFTEGLRDGGDGCSCDEMCGEEFDKWGTTQTQFSSQVRRVADIVVEDYGFAEGSPEYWEKYEELKQQALAECIAQCDQCAGASGSITISGPVDVISPGGYQFYQNGAYGAVTWSASMGSIDSNGFLTLSDNNGGSATITVTDECGYSAIFNVCITGGPGEWVQVDGGTYYYWSGDMCTQLAQVGHKAIACCPIDYSGQQYVVCNDNRRWRCAWDAAGGGLVWGEYEYQE